MSDAPMPTAPQLPGGRFEGREAFQQLVRDALACAAREGWSELMLCDASFHDWPLGERAAVESLQQWARTGRRLTLIAAGYDEVVRRHARFVQWRVRWDHIIVCRRAGAADPQDLPSSIWSPHWVLHRHDPLRCRGVTGTEPERRILLRESLLEWVERKSSPGFPASTLGL
nr:hypothetical protein [Alicycliphilus denitrificans]